MRTLYTLLAVILMSQVFGQIEPKISGKVTDRETGEPLPVVQIINLSSNSTATTDADGVFIITARIGDALQFSLNRYQTITRTAKSSDINGLNVAMIIEHNNLDMVVVSASKYEQRVEQTTVSIDVIKPYLIKEKNTTKLVDVFQQAPGVNINDDQANIRSGSGWSYGAGTRVLFMLDDMPLISPDAGQSQWKMVPMEMVNQLEIIKGASSALYGSSAMNGLINVRTRNADVPFTEIQIWQGVYDTPKRNDLKWWNGIRGQTGVSMATGFRRGEYGITLHAWGENDHGYQFDLIDKRLRLGFGVDRVWNMGRWEITAAIKSSAMVSTNGSALIWNSYDEAYIPLDTNATISDGITYYIDPSVKLRKGRWVQNIRGRLLSIDNNAKSSTSDYANKSTLGYGEYQSQYFFDNGITLTGGINYTGSTSNSIIFVGMHHVDQYAGYGQIDYSKGRWNANFGFRYEAWELDADNKASKPVIRGGLNYRIFKGTWLRASYGEAYRFPTMAEMYTSTNVGSINVLPNTSLIPESGWSTEIGIKQGLQLGHWKGFVDIAMFRMNYSDMMEFTFGKWGNYPGLDLRNYGFKSVNVGRAQIDGVELTLTGTGKIGPVEVRLLAGASWMNPIPLDPDLPYAYNSSNQAVTYSNTSSNPETGLLKYRYKQLYKGDIQGDYKKISLGLSVRYNDFMQNVDALFTDPNFSVFVPGVNESRANLNSGDLIFDARIHFKWTENLSIGLVSNNVNNREYSPRPTLLGAPRNFMLQIKYNH